MTAEGLPLKFEEEQAPYMLPSLSRLAADFEYLLSGKINHITRLETAIHYSEHLKASFGPLTPSEVMIDDARSNAASRIFVGAISLASRQGQRRNAAKHSNFPRLNGIIEARRSLQDDIEQYVVLNYDIDDGEIFSHLNELMARARSLVYNDTKIHEKPFWMASGLGGILGENKALATLRPAWPDIQRTDVRLDTKGVDLIFSKPEGVAGVQIKSDPKENAKLQIIDGEVPTIIVPVHPEAGSPFKFDGLDAARLNDHMHLVPNLPERLAA